jgi:hypothetical protein
VAPLDETDAQQAMPVGGTLSKLYIRLDAAPGTNGAWRFVVRKNGVDQALTCDIPNPATTCSDTTNSVAFSEGDLISLRVLSIGSTNPTDSNLRFSAKFVTA